MYLYKWYKPDHQKWYYYEPLETLGSLGSHSPTIYPSLDPCLALIVPFLHQNGYRTLPSCQGHFESESELQSKYRELEADFLCVRCQGLSLACVEDGSETVWSDSNYEFPWETYEQFKDEIYDSMGLGYLGIVNFPDVSLPSDRFVCINGTVGRDRVTHLLVRSSCESKVEKNWEDITELLVRSLRHNPPALLPSLKQFF